MGLLDDLKSKAGQLGDKARDGFEVAKDKAADLAEVAKDRAEDLVDDVRDRVDGDEPTGAAPTTESSDIAPTPEPASVDTAPEDTAPEDTAPEAPAAGFTVTDHRGPVDRG